MIITGVIKMTRWTKEDLAEYMERRQHWNTEPLDHVRPTFYKEYQELEKNKESIKMIVGIDPGQKGAIAFLGEGVWAYQMPLAGRELDISKAADLIQSNCSPHPRQNFAVVEKAHAFPTKKIKGGKEVKGQGVSSAFKFGKGYGILLGILGTLKISTVLVTPQAWKKVILAGTKKDKDAAIEYVQMKYPDFELIPPLCRKPHDGLADSICIAEYGKYSLRILNANSL